ncbi:MAG TPA: malto-oligosyltrehalose trehalohydrolase [Thermoanaerobaculia bacterium]|nr:malto-oligosyltrehalose trehalohydrolase [Thermoanaerobaculia bacterium]
MIGAELVPGGVRFRVWAPGQERVAVVIDDGEFALAAEERGYFSGLVEGAGAGTRYKFRLTDGDYPDPASRFQPDGPHGASEVIDPAFAWRPWRGVDPKNAVLYELHVGTFTKEGTYAAAMRELPRLAEIGITVIELLPVSEFPGAFGWGYDGVAPYAPTRLYGRPEDLRRFVDEAHAHGLGVILDVVYNHVGPDGSYLKKFTPRYFSKKYENEWGEPMNFDGEDAHGVREFFAANAAYWIGEFGFDGLRLDATQSLFDESETHILRDIRERVEAASGGRAIFLVGENEPQNTRLLREHGLDALWNDDWHHTARVAATGFTEGYYTDYGGSARELAAMANFGFLYQGQWYRWQKKRRGTPSRDIARSRLVCYLQNHDQIANSATGERLHELTSRGKVKALTALLLLQPQTPMLFQGQEFGARSPFLYFADHNAELAKKVRNGRREFLEQFASIKGRELAVPESRDTFERCKLDHDERDEELETLHRELLALRREQPFDAEMHASALDEHCLALRWFAGGERDRLLIVNLGDDLHFDPVGDPLLASPEGFAKWEVLWASEKSNKFEEWRIAAESAILLRPLSGD